jgi:hypothetical protein
LPQNDYLVKEEGDNDRWAVVGPPPTYFTPSLLKDFYVTSRPCVSSISTTITGFPVTKSTSAVGHQRRWLRARGTKHSYFRPFLLGTSVTGKFSYGNPPVPSPKNLKKTFFPRFFYPPLSLPG